ncbi:pentatricopeptide repeat-containing protein At5g56310-like [Solanum tuberosum]|nr:PREDICTED: pentatricopeptide repeat-containing protein At5g56310-like [Solanum tuberosum]XP_006358734.2 PREDICTED: pentatricopeptide repeat-containing protein At5g56310-like [Solanum tuberosum]XP_015169577.1 PREDICTED: pentatricopeptide repeat-containing protein At5g56310-like [Solanum tuberosum]XP_015169578.1 PREDICTED: pentatricopeptide repeat-containing protein At5g56310-like [Solanum tuberosum]
MLRLFSRPSSKLVHTLLKPNSNHPHHNYHKSNLQLQDTFLPLLKKCSNENHIYQTHGFMVHRALDQDNFILSQFFHTCSALGFVSYAYSIVTSNPNPNIYLYNTLISIFSRQRHLSMDAICLYKQARAIGLYHDTYSIPFVLNAVTCLTTSRQIHCEAILTGLNNDVHVATSLVRMYSSFGCISDARKVFDEMRNKDVGLWNAMIAGYVKAHDMDTAKYLFDNMLEKNVVSWTTIIAGYAQGNQFSQAIGVFRKMMSVEVSAKPDEVTMLAALSACAHLGEHELGEWIHSYIIKHRLHRSVSLNNTLIDMYAKSGNVKKAVELFESMETRSVVTWSTVISALAVNGYGREAINMFPRLEMVGIRPNSVTFIALLSACSHAGLVEEGRLYFKTMEEKHGISPDIRHYGCMVDLFGRAGYLDEAANMVKMMPFEANAAIWGSLLAAARNQGHVELGEQALQHLTEVEPHNSGNYSLVSNTYAALGRWSEARVARKIMKDTGVQKLPGGSFIKMKDKVYYFYSGDRSHPQCERIYRVLSHLNRVSKTALHEYWGYVELLDADSPQEDHL